MKFFHLSDLHIGKRVNDFSMLEDQRYILDEIIKIITQQKADAVLVAGDIYDKTQPSAEAVALCDDFFYALAELDKHIFIISGNHDCPERIAYGARIMENCKFHIASVYNGNIKKVSLSDEEGQVNVYLLPFIKPAVIRPYFENERIATKAIFPESPLFPHEYGEYFPVIYASGNLELLKTRTLTILGMLRPSMQGRYDALQVLSYLISEDVTAILTLDDGIPFLVAENMLSRNGNVIAILSDPISRCSSANEAKLRARIYASGLLLSVFPPSVRSERWHVVVRNNFIASISESVFLAEEKDGGPSWAVFDKVLARGGRAMLSSSMLEVPSYTWAGRHIESGSLTYSSEKDLRRLLPKKVKASKEPDLFS